MPANDSHDLQLKIQMSPVGRLETILLATDGSENAVSAETLALDICEHNGAPLHVVRAITSGAFGFLTPGGATPLAAEAEAFLDKFKAKATKRQINCSTAMPTADDPADGVVKEAKRVQADLIVKGRRKSWEPTRLLVGDATAKVIGKAPCPVLVVPKDRHRWTEILLATDGSRSSDAATVMAGAMAKCCDAKVVVLSVKVPSHSKRRQAEARPITERALRYLKQEGVTAIAVVDEGLVEDVVIGASHDGEALILLGAFGRTGFGRAFFGSKTERIVNKAKGAVLVVGARG